MKRAVMTAVVAATLMAGGMAGFKGGEVQDSDSYMENVVSDIRTQAQEELRKAFASEVTAFFESDDLSRTLGIDSGEQVKLEESIRSYIDRHGADAQKLSEAKASFEALVESVDGLSPDEIQDRISGIFE